MISNIREIMGTQNIPPFLFWASIRIWFMFGKISMNYFLSNIDLRYIHFAKNLEIFFAENMSPVYFFRNVRMSNILVNNVMDVELWMSFVKSYISKYFTFWRFCFLFKRKEKTGNEFVKDILLSRYKGK